MSDIAGNFAEVLKVLANPIRLKILALCLNKERSSKELGGSWRYLSLY